MVMGVHVYDSISPLTTWYMYIDVEAQWPAHAGAWPINVLYGNSWYNLPRICAYSLLVCAPPILSPLHNQSLHWCVIVTTALYLHPVRAPVLI